MAVFIFTFPAAKKQEETMEKIINIHIEKLPEGIYLATSEDVQGLVALGRTVTEALEIARDVARKLLEARAQRTGDHAGPGNTRCALHRVFQGYRVEGTVLLCQ
jgi:predicted RNase H-like HicB family nuclease